MKLQTLLAVLIVSCLRHVNANYSTTYETTTLHIRVDDNFRTTEDKINPTCSATISRSKSGDWNLFWAWNSILQLDLDAKGLSNMYYCMGFVEGLLTVREIHSFFGNMFGDWFTDFSQSPNPEPIYEFLLDNHNYMVNEAGKHKKKDQYWHEVDLILTQLKGLYEGYLEGVKKGDRLFALPLDFADFLFINADGDIETLVHAYNGDVFQNHVFNLDSKRLTFLSQKETRCSALIKVVESDGLPDILVGHTTWDHFESMGPRILKSFRFGENSRRSYSMSSSPGMLSSVDDFFVTGGGLVVTETTNELYNKTSLQVVKPQSLLSWVRARLANLESSPVKWAETFSRENSGTYNNQWMVVDSKHLLEDISSSRDVLLSDKFVVLEQSPGYIKYESKVDILVEQGYWASYNIPFYPEIRDLGNYSAQKPEDEFSHGENPRAKIFRREITTKVINTVDEFKELMRYNNFESDPFSKGNACLGISARCDLNDVSSPNYKASGGLDCKVISLRNVNKGFDHADFLAQIGPTHTSLPVFNWTSLGTRLKAKDLEIPTHLGQNETYNFPWIRFNPVSSNYCIHC